MSRHGSVRVDARSLTVFVYLSAAAMTTLALPAGPLVIEALPSMKAPVEALAGPSGRTVRT